MDLHETLEDMKLGDMENLSIFDVIVCVIFSLGFWSSFYKLLNLLNPAKGSEWNFYLVAMCFSILVVAASLICIVVFNPPLLTHMGEPSNTAAVVTLCFALGYFCFDTLWCVIHWTEKKDALMLMHHIVTILITCIALASGVCAEQGTDILLATEISTPLLLSRWFMRDNQMKNSVFYHINDFAFVGLFLTFRLGIGSWYVWTLLLYPIGIYSQLALAKIFLIALYLVSLGFAISILQMLYLKIKNLNKP